MDGTIVVAIVGGLVGSMQLARSRKAESGFERCFTTMFGSAIIAIAGAALIGTIAQILL